MFVHPYKLYFPWIRPISSHYQYSLFVTWTVVERLSCYLNARYLKLTKSRDRNEIASILTVGDFVLFDASDDDVEPIWLERIMSNPEWQNQGVYHNLVRQSVSFDGYVSIKERWLYMWCGMRKLTSYLKNLSIGSQEQKHSQLCRATGIQFQSISICIKCWDKLMSCQGWENWADTMDWNSHLTTTKQELIIGTERSL